MRRGDGAAALSATGVLATLVFGGTSVCVDLARAVDLSLGPDRAGSGPRHFSAPPAQFTPWHTRDFAGDVNLGGSCNCARMQIIPHCHGTHTECLGHLTREPCDVIDVLPNEPVAALVLSVLPVQGAATAEICTPPAITADQLITAAALRSAWPAALALRPQALIIRTLPNSVEKRTRDYSNGRAAYFTRDAMQFIVSRDVEHLVVDLPSLDRSHDQGLMTAHRVFFGMAPGSQTRHGATRAACTVTELAFVPDSVRDGLAVLLLQAPRLPGDALPTRPMLYALKA